MKTMKIAMVCLLAGMMAGGAWAQSNTDGKSAPIERAAVANLAAQHLIVQDAAAQKQRDMADRVATGDEPANPGPLATDISAALKPKAVRKVESKVADWVVAQKTSVYDQQWTFAALYDGVLAATDATGDTKYRDNMVQMAEKFQWNLFGDRFPNVDDLAIGKVYMALYLQHPEPARMAAVKAYCDQLVARPDDPKKLLFWWADSFYMGPPVLARLSEATGDKKYIDFMDHEWWQTVDLLYNRDEHLFARDGRYVNSAKKEPNGQPVFWSRGDGWVVAGTAMVLEAMPKDYPTRGRYETLLREITTRLAAIQGKDGLWRPGLLDADAYSLPELSGSAFYVYAMAWGVNNGVLDRKTFEPVIAKAWAGMLQYVYADGRLGSIQPIGFQPDGYKAQSSSVFGVGAFLLAGDEVEKMAKKKH